MSEVTADCLPLERLYYWANTHSDNVYMSQPMGHGIVRDYTWADTLDEVRRMASYLQSFEWPAGSRIAVISKNCAHWLMSDYAIWMAGHVSVPLYPTLTAESMRQLLEHSGCRACFVGKLDTWETMKPGMPQGMQCISYPLSPSNDYLTWDDIIAETEPCAGNPTRPANDLATIIYTSGTTGRPKGVMHNFGAFVWSVNTVLDRIAVGPTDRVLSYLPLSHVAERAIVEFGSLSAGYQIFFTESIDTFLDDLRRAKPTIFFSVPRLWIRFQQGVFQKISPERLGLLLKIPIVNRLLAGKLLRALGLNACRYAAGGAAPMPAELLNWYKRLGLEIIEAYGMTENCGVSHANEVGNTKPGFVGRACDGVEARVSPQTGELEMRSPGLMMGYFKAPDLTQATMTDDGWLKTGDKGEIDGTGRLKITGRVKDIFKTSKGKYVSPSPIEDRLVNHPGIEACCVVGANYPSPFGLVLLAEENARAVRDVGMNVELSRTLDMHLETVNSRLEPHEQIKFLVVVRENWSVENGLLTPTLKIKRNVLEEHYGRYFDTWWERSSRVIWQSRER